MSYRTNSAWLALKPTHLLQFAMNPISNQNYQFLLKSYLNRTVAKHLEVQKKEKKDKYLPMCREQQKNFMPFVATLDGILGQEAKMM
eukprot:13721070-Ditylum_brightwellii.AAC.1